MRSPSTISRALAQGRLSYIDPEKKLLLRSGLEQRFANATRCKADAPQKAQRDDGAAARVALIPEPPSPPAIATTYWERLSQKLEWVLEGAPAYWQEPSDAEHRVNQCSVAAGHAPNDSPAGQMNVSTPIETYVRSQRR